MGPKNHLFACLASLILISVTYTTLPETTPAPTQVWEQYYPEDGIFGNSIRFIVQTGDGGYAMAAEGLMKYTPSVVWLLKTSQNGSLEWQKSFEMYLPTGFAQTNDGGYAIAGIFERQEIDFSQFQSPYDTMLVITDSQGNTKYTKTYSYHGRSAVIYTSDSGFLLAGTVDSSVWVVKTNDCGDKVWETTLAISTEKSDSPFIQQVPDGGYVVFASEELFRLDSLGRLLWNKTIIENVADLTVNNVVQTLDGFLLLAFNNQDFMPQALKLDSTGNIEWTQTYQKIKKVYTLQGAHSGPSFNVTQNGTLNAAAQTSDGGYVFAGNIPDFSGYGKIVVVKTNSNGEVEWNQTFGGIPQHHYGYLGKAVIQDRDGNIIVGGSWSKSQAEPIFYLTKINASLSPPSPTPSPVSMSPKGPPVSGIVLIVTVVSASIVTAVIIWVGCKRVKRAN